MKDEYSDSHEWSFLGEKIHKIDVEIESVEHAITHSMGWVEQEDLIQFVIKLKQKRKNILEKNYKYL